MKHLQIFFLATISLIVFNTGSRVIAQDASVDNDTIQQRLEEEGLDKAPEPIQVQERQMSGEKPSSGWVDENGKPLSDEEYAERRENQKGLLKKYPWLLPVILVILGGAVLAAVKLKKKK